MRIFVLLTLIMLQLLLLPQRTFAFTVDDETVEQKIHRLDSQERLNLYQIFTEVPSSFAGAFLQATRRDEVPHWIEVGVTTVPLLYYDQDIFDQTQKVGRMWGISNSDNLKPYGRVTDNFAIMWGPSDVSSSLYFLGDGWIHLGGSALMLGYGYFGDHTRAYNTAVEALNGFLCSTLFEQALKRVFGREDPQVESYSGGAWRPFPSQSQYDSEKTRHDAFPSGHVMTTTVTFTVLRGNFPEYESWLWPTQLVYTSALMFGMTNNGNHWAGDYPLGIALGYFFGRAALKMSHSPAATAGSSSGVAVAAAETRREWLMNLSLTPSFDRLSGDPIANMRWDF